MVHFPAEDNIFFNLTSDEEPRLIQETIELSDNVIPASNSQMARNLFVLGHLLGHEDYLSKSEKMLKKMVLQIKRNPSFHANWATLLADYITGPTSISIIGDASQLCLKEFDRHYLPNVIFSGNHPETYPHVNDRAHERGKTLIYVCHAKTCYSPVETVMEALQLLEKQ